MSNLFKRVPVVAGANRNEQRDFCHSPFFLSRGTMLGRSVMGAPAFYARNFVRPALQFPALYILVIVISMMAMMRPASASGFVTAQTTLVYLCRNMAVCTVAQTMQSYCDYYTGTGSAVRHDRTGSAADYYRLYFSCLVPNSNPPSWLPYPSYPTGIPTLACPDHSQPTGTTICTCTDPYVPDPTKTRCVLEQYTISLKTADQVEPSKTATVIATVKDAQGNDKIGVAVSIKVDVNAGTGGHDHDAGRHVSPYTGTLSAATGTTGADGTVSFTFGAPEVSGTHTFTAKCDSPACTNSPVTANIDVKVDGLAPIPPSGLYALYEEDGSVIGAVQGRHPSNHYLTTTAANKLLVIAINYHHLYPQAPVLHINDASLMWGGVFDIDAEADWNTPHEEHMRGTVVDIRANSKIGAIPSANFAAFIQLAKDRRVYAKIHSPGKNNQHFHVRLLNRSE